MNKESFKRESNVLQLFKMSKIELKTIIKEENLKIRVRDEDTINVIVSKIWGKRVMKEIGNV